MNLERKLSEELTEAISKDNYDDARIIWNRYLSNIFNLERYDKRLFLLNWTNYKEYLIQNKK